MPWSDCLVSDCLHAHCQAGSVLTCHLRMSRRQQACLAMAPQKSPRLSKPEFGSSSDREESGVLQALVLFTFLIPDKDTKSRSLHKGPRFNKPGCRCCMMLPGSKCAAIVTGQSMPTRHHQLFHVCAGLSCSRHHCLHPSRICPCSFSAWPAQWDPSAVHGVQAGK
jgi:hypothetical protein